MRLPNERTYDPSVSCDEDTFEIGFNSKGTPVLNDRFMFIVLFMKNLLV